MASKTVVSATGDLSTGARNSCVQGGGPQHFCRSTGQRIEWGARGQTMRTNEPVQPYCFCTRLGQASHGAGWPVWIQAAGCMCLGAPVPQFGTATHLLRGVRQLAGVQRLATPRSVQQRRQRNKHAAHAKRASARAHQQRSRLYPPPGPAWRGGFRRVKQPVAGRRAAGKQTEL